MQLLQWKKLQEGMLGPVTVGDAKSPVEKFGMFNDEYVVIQEDVKVEER